MDSISRQVAFGKHFIQACKFYELAKSPESQVSLMRPYCSLTDARPKISSMPRPKTEAAAYLNLYKLSVEKKRLQYELDTIEQRRERIQKRLVFLENQVAELQPPPTRRRG
ncbi:MAG: hypothetical protein LH702_23605 [Phormidesmis sp. CAN_BIN44]|nr:hypothetical protein [Phormidesmis sp. CAN_BIN44]